ncbi:hypothetical protein [Klebsiella sp. K4-172]|uniref:hypothetical protein n=1 Tax=Klebsiella sp. K4-172 TaxID=2920185 RepID=UPI0024DEB041|nr:hypothetical protein [Klebsiella sp. K4-172]MDK1895512.1 hypothetical protein [Klebsiella sp. K4-172]
MENKLDKKKNQRKEWIKNLTEYEKIIFVNMLNEAAMIKRRWVNKEEKREVRNRFIDVVHAIREENRLNKNKEKLVSEQTTVSEMSIVSSDVIKVKKERKPRIRNKDNYGRLRRVSFQERRFLNESVSEATDVKDSALTNEEQRKVLCIAREQIRSQRKADEIKRRRDQERHSVEFVWKRPEHYRR